MRKFLLLFLLLPINIFAENRFDNLVNQNWTVEGDSGSSRGREIEYFTFSFFTEKNLVVVTRDFEGLHETFNLNYFISENSELLIYENNNKYQPLFVFWFLDDEIVLTSPYFTMLLFQNLKVIE